MNVGVPPFSLSQRWIRQLLLLHLSPQNTEKPYMLVMFRHRLKPWMREKKKPSRPPPVEVSTSWSCLTSSAGVAQKMICWWHFLETVVPFVFISGFVLCGSVNATKPNRADVFVFFFLSALKMRKRFHKDPENGKKVSSSVGPDLSKMRRKGVNAAAAWTLFPTMTPKEAKHWR